MKKKGQEKRVGGSRGELEGIVRVDKKNKLYACSSIFSITVTEHSDQYQFEEERVYLVTSSRSQFITEGTQDRNLESGAEA